MRIKAILSATVLAGAALAALPMTAAHAAADPSGGVGLPLNSFFQLAVDNTHDHLFLSQGNSGENGILVTDFAGNTVATIDHQIGVMGITLSPDGKTLYAALSGLHEVSAISTATLRQTAVYPLGDGNTPLSVAVQSGKLFVSYDSSNPDASIGYFNLSAANPTLETSSVLDEPPGVLDWLSAPLLAADPTGRGNVLVAMHRPDSRTRCRRLLA
jgi:DNA-binding beta-propeller fold protein YncE